MYFSASQIDPSYGNQTLADDSTRDMYLGVYGGLGFGQAMSVITGALFLYLATLQGARKLHDNILSNVLRLPMSYFDTTPQGRILNRYIDIRYMYSGDLNSEHLNNGNI